MKNHQQVQDELLAQIVHLPGAQPLVGLHKRHAFTIHLPGIEPADVKVSLNCETVRVLLWERTRHEDIVIKIDEEFTRLENWMLHNGVLTLVFLYDIPEKYAFSYRTRLSAEEFMARYFSRDQRSVVA